MKTENARQLVEKTADEIISVPNVKEVMVLVFENQLFIGLNLSENKSTQKTEETEREVYYRTRMISNDLVKIYITSESDLVLHLYEIIQKVKKGKAISDFSPELQRLSQLIGE